LALSVPLRGQRYESGVAQLFSLGHMTHEDNKKIITKDAQVRNGEACIRGLPITVAEIAERFSSGASLQQILADYPQLTREDILACLDYLAHKPFGEYLY